MENQTVLYIYSFPSYLKEEPKVKIGRTSGNVEESPNSLAWKRISSQTKTAHPEQPQLLCAITVPGDWVETAIHSELKKKGYHISDAPGIEWFKFPHQKQLQDFLNKLHEAAIIDNFSEIGGGGVNIDGNSFDSIIKAFGVHRRSGQEFRNETNLIRTIGDELSAIYPGFFVWLDKTMNDPKAVFNVAYRDEKAVGVAIWKPKTFGIVKLSTLFVTPNYRSSGIGKNLILTCFEQWKLEKVRRAFVTTARVELIKFFERYGFWVEGMGREIYERDEHQPEWFLTKLFFYNSDLQHLDAIKKAKILFPSIIPNSYKPDGRKEVEQIQCNDGTIQITASDGSLINQLSLNSWLNLTYPGESVFTPNTAYVIPIKPGFLIQFVKGGKTVYYGRCIRKKYDMRGASILFYATDPVKAVVAVAKIVDRYIGSKDSGGGVLTSVV